MPNTLRQLFFANVLWFLGCLILAFAVWFVANIQANPIEQRQFANVPIQIQYDDESLIITNRPPTTARVIVRAQRSTLNLLTSEDIVVQADATDKVAGGHTVPLQVTLSRPGSADTQPAQIRLELAQVVTQQKPIRIEVSEAPTDDFDYEAPVPELLQVAVSGASERVNRVVAAYAELNLSQQRNPYETEMTLVAIDEDGDRVTDVTLMPRSVMVSVNIQRRDNVRRFAVSPDILVDTLSPDYMIATFSYTPESVLISGSPSVLNTLTGTLRTDPISLEGRLGSFEVTVPLRLPSSLFVLNNVNAVTVQVGIVARTTTVQIDGVAVDVTGLAAGFEVDSLSPQRISVLLTGPVSVVNAIEASEIQAILNLSAVQVGNNAITPTIVFRQGQLNLESVVLIPSVVNVSVIASATATPSPTSTAIFTPIPSATPAP